MRTEKEDERMMVRIAVLAVASAALVSDLRSGRIGNWLSAAGLTAAVLCHLAEPATFWLCPAGAAVPLLLGWPLFRLHMIGAGDVKLLMALGALTGAADFWPFLAVVLVFGGVLSLVLMLAFSGVKGRLLYFSSWVSRGLRTGKWAPYRTGGTERTENFHFTVPVLMAAVCYAGGMF